MSREILNYICVLITDKDAAKRVVENANIPLGSIDFNAAPKNMWFRIFTEAKKYNGGPLRIIQSALLEYPDDEALKNEENRLLINSSEFLPTAGNITPTSSSIDKGALKNLIAGNKFERVFEILDQYKDQINSDQQNELVLLKSGYNAYKKDSRLDLASSSELVIRKNKLMFSLMRFIDSI